ncbi:MAG: hypothetical protein ACE37F_23355 [Nannocystaceae bacterium]|nr:hypothetical protein [bacterium]
MALSLAGCFDPGSTLVVTEENGSTGGPSSGSGGPTGSPADASTSTSPGSGPTTAPNPESTSGPESSTGPDSSPDTTDDSADPTTGGDSDDTSGGADDTSSSSGQPDSDSDACVQDCAGIACGVDPVCNLECPEQCSGSAECAEDQTYCGIRLGYPDFLGSDGEVVGDIMFGHRVTVPFGTTLKAIGVLAGGAGAEVQMAVYTDVGGPQTRLRQTGEVVLASGSNEIAVPDTDLPAGDYWIMLHTEGLTLLGRTLPGDNDYEFAYVFATYPPDGSESFPLTMTGDQIVADHRYNLFIVVED